jgi:hypothetical protein
MERDTFNIGGLEPPQTHLHATLRPQIKLTKNKGIPTKSIINWEDPKKLS